MIALSIPWRAQSETLSEGKVGASSKFGAVEFCGRGQTNSEASSSGGSVAMVMSRSFDLCRRPIEASRSSSRPRPHFFFWLDFFSNRIETALTVVGRQRDGQRRDAGRRRRGVALDDAAAVEDVSLATDARGRRPRRQLRLKPNKKKAKKKMFVIFFRMKTGDVIGRSARDWPSINGSHRSKRGNERNERTNDQRAAVYWERK